MPSRSRDGATGSASPGQSLAKPRRRRWRDYQTERGRRPVKEFITSLSAADAAAVVAGMAEVAREGLSAPQHVRGDLYEVKALGKNQAFRILFAPEGRHDQVLLALEGISKKTQKLPDAVIELALRRLRDWRQRGEERRSRQMP